VGFTTVPAERPGLSTEATRLHEDTRNLAVRAGPARVLSAATARADRQGAIRHAEAGASAAGQRPAAEDLAVAGEPHTSAVVERLAPAVAGIGNRSLGGVWTSLGQRSHIFTVDGDNLKWREALCGE